MKLVVRKKVLMIFLNLDQKSIFGKLPVPAMTVRNWETLKMSPQ